ncbi:hypothetical protein [Streptomyces hypolithicus]
MHIEHARTGIGRPIPIDSRWWEELRPPHTDVLLDDTDTAIGVASYAIRPRDEVGLLLWMHCCEDHSAAESLVRHVLDDFGPRTVFAFG